MGKTTLVSWMGCMAMMVWAMPIEAKTAAVVLSRSLQGYQEASQGFKSKTSLTVEEYNLNGDQTQGAAVMKEVMEKSPDVIIAVGSEALDAALEYTTTTPLVYCMVLKTPVISGRLHGGVLMNITPEVQLMRLRKLLPKSRTLGVLYNPDKTGKLVEGLRPLIAAKNMTLVDTAVYELSELTSALHALQARNVDVLWAVPDQTLVNPAVTSQVISFALQNKIPYIDLSAQGVKKGALATVFVDFEDLGRQTAELAQRMLAENLSGAVESPRRIITFINLRTAEHLGILDIEALKAQPDIQWVQ